MKRKRAYKVTKTLQNDATPVVEPEPEPRMSRQSRQKFVCDGRTEESITSLHREPSTPRTATITRGRQADLAVGQNDNGVEMNTNALGQMIATIIKEISKEPGDLANLSKSLVDNSISNVQMREPHPNMEPEGKKNRPHQNPEYKKPELSAALAVIKKTMELDAANPFNRPVDPVALEIPDYFDIIDAPMDFGTICNNLENGVKYMNSTEVFRDVELIWYNCLKYNKKGDHILELMKRVKTHFMKFWKAAGLHTEPSSPTVVSVEIHSNVRPPTKSSISRHNKQQNNYSLTQRGNNFAQLDRRGAGFNQIAEDQPGSTTMPSGPPQKTSSQSQSSSEQEVLDIGTPDSTNTRKKHQVREPTRGHILLPTSGRIKISTNELGQPVGPEATELTSFLGLTARDVMLAPLIYPTWSKMPKKNKENIWQKVMAKFDIDPRSRKWVMSSLRSKWRNFKFYLKASHYDTHATDEERLADRDARVPPDQWAFLVSQWSSDQWRSLSARNKEKRAMVKFIHTAGRKSFARVLEEERAKRPDGQEPSPAELFILTRTNKNGEPVNEATAAVISRLRASTSQDEMSPCGQSTTSSLPQTTIPTHAEALKMVEEKDAEVVEMKERLASVEQTCSQMAAQVSAMVSMMAAFQNGSAAQCFPNDGAGTFVPVGMTNQAEPSRIQTRGRKKRQSKCRP